MNNIKKIGKAFLITTLTMLILILILTILNYIDFINGKITNILKIIIPLISIGIGGFTLGKKANKNGYLEGLKFGLILTTIIAITNLLFFNISIKDIVFYIILIISSIIGSMIGINRKKK